MSRIIEIWPNKKFNTTLILAEFPASREDIRARDRRLLQTGPRQDSYSSTCNHPRDSASPEVIYVTSLVMRCNVPL